jgi:hypothetical protein
MSQEKLLLRHSRIGRKVLPDTYRNGLVGNGRGSTSDDDDGEHEERESIDSRRHGKSW